MSGQVVMVMHIATGNRGTRFAEINNLRDHEEPIVVGRGSARRAAERDSRAPRFFIPTAWLVKPFGHKADDVAGLVFRCEVD